MLLHLTDHSPEPLRYQVLRQIRAMILSGDLPPDSPLDSIRMLARRNQISVITVQRAYEDLEREGLIHARRRKGFFVSGIKETDKRELATQRLLSSLSPILQQALNEGLDPTTLLDIIREHLITLRGTS